MDKKQPLWVLTGEDRGGTNLSNSQEKPPKGSDIEAESWPMRRPTKPREGERAPG